jgi:hypothetical protein
VALVVYGWLLNGACISDFGTRCVTALLNEGGEAPR